MLVTECMSQVIENHNNSLKTHTTISCHKILTSNISNNTELNKLKFQKMIDSNKYDQS